MFPPTTFYIKPYISDLQGGPEVSGHFQNHSQNRQKWAFSKIENKYFLISIVNHILQGSNISLEEVSSQVSTCGSL